jgi:hypothetical protein
MFCSKETPQLARRLLDALYWIRCFLTLEDDYDVDWEVDQEQQIESLPARERDGRVQTDCATHPHRVALRSPLGIDSRRPGMPSPREQVCLCPIPQRQRSEAEPQRGSRITTGSVRVAIDR